MNCLCGCGEKPKEGNKFINGHNTRVSNPNPKKIKKIQKCACNCGGYTKPGRKYILGHNFRNIPKTEMHKKKIGDAHRNKPKSKEHIQKIIETKISQTGGNAVWWSRKIRQENNNTCYLCKSTDYAVGHHKDEDRGNNSRDNLCCICMPCHKFWHEN